MQKYDSLFLQKYGLMIRESTYLNWSTAKELCEELNGIEDRTAHQHGLEFQKVCRLRESSRALQLIKILLYRFGNGVVSCRCGVLVFAFEEQFNDFGPFGR